MDRSIDYRLYQSHTRLLTPELIDSQLFKPNFEYLMMFGDNKFSHDNIKRVIEQGIILDSAFYHLRTKMTPDLIDVAIKKVIGESKATALIINTLPTITTQQIDLLIEAMDHEQFLSELDDSIGDIAENYSGEDAYLVDWYKGCEDKVVYIDKKINKQFDIVYKKKRDRHE